MSFGWHPREHRKALDGMLSLTLEERGAYNTLLDLIYDREGPIPDDSRWLAGWMGVSARKWSVIRAALIVAGKIYETSVNGTPSLMNRRAAIEIENQAKLSRKLRENGAKGGRKRAETETEPNEINDNVEALGSAPLKLKTETRTYSSVASSNEEPTGGEPPDLNREAWSEAVPLLVGQGGMTVEAAKAFFGKLLSQNRLQARDLLGAVNEARVSATQDPQGYLARAASGRGSRRQTGPPKRVGFV